MNKLPEPTWISLQETLDIVLDRTGEDLEAVKRSLIDAFVERKIETQGRGGSYGGLVPQPEVLGAEWYGATVYWESGKLWPADGHFHGIRYVGFDQIKVRREDVTRWLESANDGDDASPPDQGRQPIEPRIGMEIINQWLQKRYDEWNGTPAGPSIQGDWDAASEKFGEGKVTRKQIVTARASVKHPKSFHLNKPGRKPSNKPGRKPSGN